MSKYTIVGIDAGINMSWAIIDFEGNLIEVCSSRIARNPEREILKHGKPVAVCTDVSRDVKKVKKIATNLGAVYFKPERDLTPKEKTILSSPFKTKNRHERDALSSALYFHKKIKGLIKRAKRRGNWEEKTANVILKKAHDLSCK